MPIQRRSIHQKKKRKKTPNGGDSADSHLVTVNVAVKRAHRRVQARAVRTPVLVSKLEHLHFNRYIHTTVIFSDADRLIETLITYLRGK